MVQHFQKTPSFVWMEVEILEIQEVTYLALIKIMSSKSNINLKAIIISLIFHSFLTDSIGFSGDDNGKTSGLASYGNAQEHLKDRMSSLISISVEEELSLKDTDTTLQMST